MVLISKEFVLDSVIEYKCNSIYEFKSKEYLSEGKGSLGNAC